MQTLKNEDFNMETAVIRKWSGKWASNDPSLPTVNNPPGGYVITFHKGFNNPYRVEHHATVEAIKDKYDHQYFWIWPTPYDAPDIVLVGI